MVLILNLGLVAILISISQSAEIPENTHRDDLVALLAKRMDAFEAANEALSDENEDLRARIKALEALAMKQQRELVEQAVDNRRLEERLSKLEGLDKPGSSKKAQHNSSMDAGSAISRIRKASGDVSVAFMSVLIAHIENPGVHQAITFDHVITNIGNGYNQHAGDFRAPVSGIYVFSTTLMSGNQGVPYHFQIMHNGNPVSKIYVPHGGTAGMDAVLHLNQGDDVTIHNIDAGHRVYGDGYASFSGFLLQEDIPEIGIVG